MRQERDILERAVQAVADQADDLVDEAKAMSSIAMTPLPAEEGRLELLKMFRARQVKADVERGSQPGCSQAKLAARRFTGSRASPWRTQGTGVIASLAARRAPGQLTVSGGVGRYCPRGQPFSRAG